METYRAEVLIDRRFVLSESPVWDERDQSLHFADIKGNSVYRFDTATGDLTSVDVCQNVGCFALREGGGYILGLASGVYLMNAAHDRLERLPAPVTNPMTRFNDGKCDPRGRFFCGTMDLFGFGKHRGGSLYALDGNGRCATLLTGVGCSNGIAFADGGDTVYYIDTTRRRVERYAFDADAMALRDLRVVVEIDSSNGSPDGMTLDEDGMLWVAHWGAGFIGRYCPQTGKLLCRVEVAATQSSSCCFGGDDMRTLFITSGRGGEDEKHGGCVFSVRLPYRGVRSARYGG